MATLGDHGLDDVNGRKQTPESLDDRARQSASVADMDIRGRSDGSAADECRLMDRLRSESLEVERKRSLTEREVLAAHAQFGQLDGGKVKEGMGSNWPKHWDGIFAAHQPPPNRRAQQLHDKLIRSYLFTLNKAGPTESNLSAAEVDLILLALAQLAAVQT